MRASLQCYLELCGDVNHCMCSYKVMPFQELIVAIHGSNLSGDDKNISSESNMIEHSIGKGHVAQPS